LSHRLAHQGKRQRDSVGWRRTAVASSAALALVLVAPSAAAYRPFDSTDADVAARGEFELELGPIGYLRYGEDKYLTASAFVANLGIVDRVEAVVQGTELVLVNHGTHGSFVDAGAFLKIVLREGSLQEGTGPSIATEVGALLPTINAEPGAGYSAAVIASQRWRLATVHLNLQGAQTRAGNADAFVGAILEGPSDWVVRPVAEAFYEDEIHVAQTVSGLVGCIARASDSLSLDVGLRAARVDTTPVFEVRAGFTWGFSLWGGHE
jgi:hypothetical protein